MVSAGEGNSLLFETITLLYAGELSWREPDTHFDGIHLRDHRLAFQNSRLAIIEVILRSTILPPVEHLSARRTAGVDPYNSWWIISPMTTALGMDGQIALRRGCDCVLN
jgi:hypothetical protein